jgi:hypothetical protein
MTGVFRIRIPVDGACPFSDTWQHGLARAPAIRSHERPYPQTSVRDVAHKGAWPVQAELVEALGLLNNSTWLCRRPIIK